MNIEDITPLLKKVIDLLGMEENKTDDVLKILGQVVIFIELGGIVADGLSGLKDVLDGDDMSQAELVKILNKNRAKIESAKLLVKPQE